MNAPRVQNNSRPQFGISPDAELFIYYLKGRLARHDPVFQTDFIGNWEEGDDSILFFSNSADQQIETLLNRQPHLEYVDSYRMPYDDWLGEKFSTFEHGTFRIMPPWEAAEDGADAAADKLQILLDPGLVFGTGTHPTTRDCLEALELAAGSEPVSSVLDLGTGTGLLALAAARLGSARVLGADLNLLAARTAASNVRLNRLQDRVVIVQGRAEDMIACPVNLLIANIHYDVMQNLINTGGFLAKKRFILSGLMRSEAKHIASTLQRQPVKLVKQWTPDGIWHTIYGETVQKHSRTCRF
jgi:ribosomal protein L11 methyltransferase